MPWAPKSHHASDKPKQRQSLTRQRCKLYQTNRWKEASAAFRRENVLCKSCEARGIIRPSAVTDHIEGHDCDPVRFFDSSKWAALCSTCHNKKSGREAHQ